MNSKKKQTNQERALPKPIFRKAVTAVAAPSKMIL
jgi:hypothetical protein